jgi:hypothetical protein
MTKRSLKIWHRVRHDDFEVTEIPLASLVGDEERIEEAHDAGGFILAGPDGLPSAFIPWHSVSWIEIVTTNQEEGEAS